MDDGSEQPAGLRGEYRFGIVLILLLATFVVLMTGSTAKWLRPLSILLTGGTLLAALFASGTALRLRRITAVVVAIVALASISLVWLGRSGGGGQGLVNAALIVIAPFAIARSVVRRRIIDARTIMASLCIYVLFAMLWAFVFTAIGDLGSTHFFAQSVTPTSADYLYFSFITQLTVGYGDLTAASNLGRSCAVLEALLGQIYLVTVVAVLVSRLVPRAPNSTGPTVSE
jgi:drug/metabolite transporter (DMT)-like permease